MSSPSPVFTESTADQQTGTSSTSFYKAKVVSITDGAAIQRTIPIDALYPDTRSDSGALRSALKLLDDAFELVKEAAALQWSDPVASDDRINRLIPVLQELFCWRELGEGFATAINGLLFGVKNHVSETWDGSQLKALADVFYSVRSEPYLDFDMALRHIEQLESVGLTPEPREIEILADWLDAQSVG